MKVIVVQQLRQMGKLQVTREIECTTIDDAARLRTPYEILKPKFGPPYKVLGAKVFIREVPKITKPVDDDPPEKES